MANVKISGIAAETTAADTDLIEIENASAVSKSMTRANFFGGEQTISGFKTFTGDTSVGVAGTSTRGIAADVLLTNMTSSDTGNRTAVFNRLHLEGDLSGIGELWGGYTQLMLGVGAGSSQGITVVPPATTIANGFEAGAQWLPGQVSNLTLPVLRGIDADVGVGQNGTITKAHGVFSHIRATNNDTNVVTKFIGFESVGPVHAGFQTAWGNSLVDYVAFRAGFDDRSTLAADIDGDYIGLQIDDTTTNPGGGTGATVLGTEYGIWINSDAMQALTFGKDKDVYFDYDGSDLNLTGSWDGSGWATGHSTLYVSSSATGDITGYNAKINSAAQFLAYHSASSITPPAIHTARATYAVAIQNSTDTLRNLIGSNVKSSVTAAGTVTDSWGYKSQVGSTASGAHTLTTHYGVACESPTGANMTITNYFGLTVEDPNGSSATVTNPYGIWLQADGMGGDITLGADKDISIYFDGTNLRMDGASFNYDTTGAPVASTGFVSINIAGTVYKFLVAT